jgi:predicted transposase/invertase (TIGR01784 family)
MKNKTEQKDRYINLFTDFGFKKIFGSEPNKDLLIDFLNELLKTKEKIKHLTYKKTEHLGFSEVDRKAIFDLYCENERGEKFIVELQKVKQQFFKDRSVYYATFPIQEQGQKGEWDYQLKAVYCVGILDFVFDNEDKDKLVVDEVALMSKKTNKVFYDKLTFVYVQMPNFLKTEKELKTHEDKWFYLFKNLHKLDNIPTKLQNKIFKKAFEIAEIAKYSETERLQYLDSLKHYLDLTNSFKSVRIEGREEGRIEGLKEGRIEGKIEAKREFTVKLILKGYSDEMIKDLTELEEGDIVKLRAELADNSKNQK